MRKNKKSAQSSKMQRGQILVIVVFAIVGLVAFVGLVVDTGLVFIGYGTLRRSVDAAALAAAAQYRKQGITPLELEQSAVEFLVLNNVEDPSARIWVCNENFPSYHDASLCTAPARRRLVKVDAASTVPLAFLPVIGIRTVTLNATATSEAASLDIILALDVSESMTWAEPDTSLMRDPSECNAVRDADGSTSCHPFHEIQQAAQDFVSNLLAADGSDQYDRISIIPFHKDVNDGSADYDNVLHFDEYPQGGTPADYQAYRQTILDTIASLSVYQASGSPDPRDPSAPGPHGAGSCLDWSGGAPAPNVGNAPCRWYILDEDLKSNLCGFDEVAHPNGIRTGDLYAGVPTVGYDVTNTACFTEVEAGDAIYSTAAFEDTSTGKHYERKFTQFACNDSDPTEKSHCGTSNIGGAFNAAGNEFVGKLGTHPNSFRQESLWVTILLTDGVANHSDGNLYCPAGENYPNHWCQDYGMSGPPENWAVNTRHCLTQGSSVYGSDPELLYNVCIQPPPDGGGGSVDVNLYDADDYARDMADFVAVGQQAMVFTIGFDTVNPPLLGHSDPGNDYGEQLLNYAADVGDDGQVNTPAGTFNPNYFFTNDVNTLDDIFQTITDQIATRLSH